MERAKEGDIDVDVTRGKCSPTRDWRSVTSRSVNSRTEGSSKPSRRRIWSSTPYMLDDERYGSIEEAMADVEYTAGWDRMFEVRSSHNDVTFLDGFLTQEFVVDNEYFTYEFSRTTGDYRVSSTGVRGREEEADAPVHQLRKADYGRL